jgi:hypothetical protein
LYQRLHRVVSVAVNASQEASYLVFLQDFPACLREHSVLVDQAANISAKVALDPLARELAHTRILDDT